MQWKFILSLFVILIFVAFSAQNWAIVSIKFLTYTIPVSLAFLILFSILLGFILGTIIAGLNQLRIRKEMKILREKISKQNEELKYLRYLQIKDDE